MILLCPLQCNIVWMLKMRMDAIFPRAEPNTELRPFNRSDGDISNTNAAWHTYNEFTLNIPYTVWTYAEMFKTNKHKTVSGLWIGCGVEKEPLHLLFDWPSQCKSKNINTILLCCFPEQSDTWNAHESVVKYRCSLCR